MRNLRSRVHKSIEMPTTVKEEVDQQVEFISVTPAKTVDLFRDLDELCTIAARSTGNERRYMELAGILLPESEITDSD